MMNDALIQLAISMNLIGEVRAGRCTTGKAKSGLGLVSEDFPFFTPF